MRRAAVDPRHRQSFSSGEITRSFYYQLLFRTTSANYFSFPRPVDLKSRSRPETALQRGVFFTGSNNALQEARTCIVFMRLTWLRGEETVIGTRRYVLVHLFFLIPFAIRIRHKYRLSSNRNEIRARYRREEDKNFTITSRKKHKRREYKIGGTRFYTDLCTVMEAERKKAEENFLTIDRYH